MQSGNTNLQQLKSWINDASPDDLIVIGKTVTGKIAQLDQTYRDRFVQNLDPSVTRLFDKTHA